MIASARGAAAPQISTAIANSSARIHVRGTDWTRGRIGRGWMTVAMP